MVTEPWSDLGDFGARVRAARAYVGESQDTFADRLEISDRTLRDLEAGKRTDLGKTPLARKALARNIIEATECPAGLFGLPEPVDSVDAIREELDRRILELRTELSAEIEKARTTLEARSPIPGHGEYQGAGNDK